MTKISYITLTSKRNRFDEVTSALDITVEDSAVRASEIFAIIKI